MNTVTSDLNRTGLYDFLSRNCDQIVDAARRIGDGLGLPDDLKGKVGQTGAVSAMPGRLRRDVVAAMKTGMEKTVSPREIGDEIRRVVKSVYGDEYDAVPTNSCEAALFATYDALFTPPRAGVGKPYRSRVVGTLERHYEHHHSYGRPFPPRLKDVLADRGATAGELGLIGRVQCGTECVMVPIEGARYELHGLKMHATPLLMEADAGATVAALARAAKIHARDLAGFVSLGYETCGFGNAAKAPDGAPVLHKGMAALASEYAVPYVIDNAWGTPFVGVDPRAVGADVILYSMDKVSGAPASGLAIGKEWPMVNVRRALGVHGERFGTVSAHGKGLHVHADPGKMAMLGILAALTTLRDRPKTVTDPIDDLYEIVSDELERANGDLPEGVVLTKSYNMGGVELNYERTWRGRDGKAKIGIPIFNHEDRIAGSNLLANAMIAMGIVPGPIDDGNMIFTPGLGTVDEDGNLHEGNMRLVVRGAIRALALLGDWADWARGNAG